MATEVETGQCERCQEPNGWRFLDKEYKHMCGACAETKDAIYMGGYYRYGARCSGSDCNTFGVVNYRDGTDERFYCGGSPRCIP